MGTAAATFALLYPGDRAARALSDRPASRFALLFAAFEPAVYHDDFCDEVGAQLRKLRGVLVWHNPSEGGRTRSRLDAMLRRVAEQERFQQLRRRLEGECIALLTDRLAITRDRLPMLWDADFIPAEVEDPTQERQVLCEIKVSSVAPCPESANAAIIAAAHSLLA